MTEKQELPDIFQQNGAVHPVMDAEILSAKATAALSGLTDMYRAQMATDIPVMQELLDQASVASDEDRFTLIRTKFFNKMHDLKGQGATFGYPLLTDLGAFACDYLRHKTQINNEDLTVLSRLLLDIQTIYQDDLTGDGGDKGQVIRTHLAQEFHG